MLRLIFTFVFSLMATVGACAQKVTLPPKVQPKIGAYYFGGWTKDDVFHKTPRLLGEFADREPLLGWFEDAPGVMEKQIDFAADAGLSFWAFDWYWYTKQKQGDATSLHTAMNLYLKARNVNRLNFCLTVCNHEGGDIPASDWDTVTSRWVQLFAEPSYLRIQGKPVIVIYDPRNLFKAFGNRVDRVKQAMDQFRTKARNDSRVHSDILIGCCALPGPENGMDDLGALAKSGYDFFTGYTLASFPAGRDAATGTTHVYYPYSELLIYPYSSLIKGHEFIWDKFAQKSTVPYFPVVTAGWDRRPWEPTMFAPTVYYPDCTPPQVTELVRKAIAYVGAHPSKTVSQQLIFIYAWNEIGEGGFILPTKAKGDAYLKAIAAAMK